MTKFYNETPEFAETKSGYYYCKYCDDVFTTKHEHSSNMRHLNRKL